MLARTIPTDDGVVSMEPFALAIRYHGTEGEFGSPFTFVCTALIVGTEARLFAGAGKMTGSVWRAIAAALSRQGIETVTFERRNKPRKRDRKHRTAQ